MAMLHKGPAPGRDIHEHFNLAVIPPAVMPHAVIPPAEPRVNLAARPVLPAADCTFSIPCIFCVFQLMTAGMLIGCNCAVIE